MGPKEENKDGVLKGLIRHLLTTVGGSLVAKGFEYRERRNSLGEELVVVGDPELANRVKECRNSVNRHKEKKHYFETWNRVLGSQLKRDPQSTLLLKYDDIKFFGL